MVTKPVYTEGCGFFVLMWAVDSMALRPDWIWGVRFHQIILEIPTRATAAPALPLNVTRGLINS